jgi:dihydrodipicolinate synthase/N-acetylneuraminate lyase
VKDITMNKLVSFKGILAPIPTPFNATTGAVYEKGVENLLFFLKKAGVHGVFALGSYGSFPLLDRDERFEAMEIITRKCKELGLFNVMHIGAAGTSQALVYARYAEELEVDAIASVSPYYYSGHAYRWEDIREYHQRLIESTELPYCIYNNPRTTSFSLSPEQLRELAVMGASGLKDSGNDVCLFKDYFDATSDLAFNCMPGSGSVMLDCFLLGARSIVAGTSVCFPEEVVALYNAFQAGASAKKLESMQMAVTKCRERQMANIMRAAAAYVLLRDRGVDIGQPRSPWPRHE